MRITLTRYGGHTAGMKLPATSVDVSTLEPAAAAQLTRLAEAALHTAPAVVSRAATPDMMTYAITIERDGGSTTLKQPEPTATSPFAELLDYLEQLG